jgi:hypothetical protein
MATANRIPLFSIPGFKYSYLDSIDSETAPEKAGRERRSPIFVLFTSVNRTLKALEKAGWLSHSLHTSIEILVVQTVPFALSLETPPVSNEFIVKRLREIADRLSIQIKISVYLCRDPLITLKRILNRNCRVVMGVPKTKWRPAGDRIMARKLQRAGFDVIAVETE